MVGLDVFFHHIQCLLGELDAFVNFVLIDGQPAGNAYGVGDAVYVVQFFGNGKGLVQTAAGLLEIAVVHVDPSTDQIGVHFQQGVIFLLVQLYGFANVLQCFFIKRSVAGETPVGIVNAGQEKVGFDKVVYVGLAVAAKFEGNLGRVERLFQVPFSVVAVRIF